MPELPEVETVRNGLSRHLHGERISKVELNREGLRFPFPDGMATALEGRTVIGIDRRAKYLLVRLDAGSIWLIHLGMTGKFTLYNSIDEVPGQIKHDHVVIHTASGKVAVYNDPRRFGIMDIISPGAEDEHSLLGHLGLEPLSDEFDALALASALRGRRSPIKTALLDQRLVVGLGNIYVCEILHRSGVSPNTLAGELVRKDGIPRVSLSRIADEIRQVLVEAIEAGGSTISDFASVDGDLGYFAHSFQVYGREGEPCLGKVCTGTIRRIVQGGRSTFYCSRCQRS